MFSSLFTAYPWITRLGRSREHWLWPARTRWR